jgi:16S rRNA (adenine1518-N6/adenine1519-N6)-dimethyltransferase
LQKETAQRFMATSGTKMGAISISLNGAFQAIHRHPVAPSCFFPRPKVDSVLVHWERRPDPFIFSDRTYGLIRFLFNHRRKQLRGIIQRMDVGMDQGTLSQWVQSLGSPMLRAEEISLRQWQHLEDILGYAARRGEP